MENILALNLLHTDILHLTYELIFYINIYGTNLVRIYLLQRTSQCHLGWIS